MEKLLKLKINNIYNLLISTDQESKILGLSLLIEELPESILSNKFDIRNLCYLNGSTKYILLFSDKGYIVTLKYIIETTLLVSQNSLFYPGILQICCILKSYI